MSASATGSTVKKQPVKTQRFAWDGFSFAVPSDWNLSLYHPGRRSSRIEMEDDYSRRLELEWTRLAGSLHPEDVQRRYAKAARKLTEAAKTTRAVDLPPGWTAHVYTMAGGQSLVTAYYLAGKALFAFFTLHFDKSHTDDPASVLRAIADTFQSHAAGAIPWTCYDLNFELSSDFKLVDTSLMAGRKSMVFQWRLRRFHIWSISLANIALKNKALPAWAAEFLNQADGVQGRRFVANADGSVSARRKAYLLFGHAEELRRMCFRYEAGFRHVEAHNQIVVWVYRYRFQADLQKLSGFRLMDIPAG